MASSPADLPSTAAQSIPHSTAPADPQGTSHDALSSAPVEMRTLHTPPAAAPDTATTAATTTAPGTTPDTAPAAATTTTQLPDTSHAAHAEPTAPHVSESTSAESTQPAVPTSAQPAPRAELNRTETEAIGPSTDSPAANPDNTNGPTVVIMLLLTTGKRHPYKIDERYLKKRNVTVENMDPYNISVYTLKELIWRDWRDEWEPRPTSPSAIRLIHFGRMLDDKLPLKDCRFQSESPNVVHMTVKPQEVIDDEENAKTGKAASRRDGDEEPTATCRCVIL